MLDFRVTRHRARELLLREDAFRRARMPFFRNQPPLDEATIARGLTRAATSAAFRVDDETFRDAEIALAGATPAQLIGFWVEYIDGDIQNGGFHQMFMNTTGDYAAAIVPLLRRIEETPRAEIFERAMERFPGGLAPRSRAARQRVLSSIAFESDWCRWIAPIESAYYALDSAVLSMRVSAYLDAHPEEIFLDD